MIKHYALYKGDTYLTSGTKYQLANYLNVKLRTIQFYLTPTYNKRIEKNSNSIKVIEI